MRKREFRRAQAAGIAVAILAATPAPAFAEAGPTVLYVSTTAALSTNGGPTSIPGLSLTLPAITSKERFAVVTLNLANLYVTPGTGTQAYLALVLGNSQDPLGLTNVLDDVAAGTPGAPDNGRKPVTVVVKVPLGTSPTTINATWGVVTANAINTDTFASLSALLVSK